MKRGIIINVNDDWVIRNYELMTEYKNNIIESIILEDLTSTVQAPGDL